MCVKEGAAISAANFERVQGILSNPVAFQLSTVFNNQRTFLDTSGLEIATDTVAFAT